MTFFYKAALTACISLTLLLPKEADANSRMAGSFGKSQNATKVIEVNLDENLNKIPDDLISFYELREWKPLWVDNKTIMEDALETIQSAWTHGLYLEDYSYNELQSLSKKNSQRARVELEIKITENIIKLAQDLSGPSIDPSTIDSDSNYWPKPLSQSEILENLSSFKKTSGFIDAVAPSEPLYLALQDRLTELGETPDFGNFETHQIVANMERLRWIPREKPSKYVFVNVAQAHLWAIEDGKTALEMPVVVGKPWRPTYTFTTHIKGVRFNPRWTVPITIKRFDFLPKLKKDPFALAKKNIELYDGFGRNASTIAADAVDWNNLEKGELNKIVFRQGPGDDNPLGRYRLLMPNKFNVFLHDTNSPELFSREKRTLSSGCVRVKYPDQLSAFVLNDDSTDYSHYLDTNKQTDIPANRIPVFVAYLTASLDDQNHLIYHKDVYKYDVKMTTEIFKGHEDFSESKVASLSK